MLSLKKKTTNNAHNRKGQRSIKQDIPALIKDLSILNLNANVTFIFRKVLLVTDQCVSNTKDYFRSPPCAYGYMVTCGHPSVFMQQQLTTDHLSVCKQ